MIRLWFVSPSVFLNKEKETNHDHNFTWQRVQTCADMKIHQNKAQERSWPCPHFPGTYLPVGYIQNLKKKAKSRKSDVHFLHSTSTVVIVLSRLPSKFTVSVCFSLVSGVCHSHWSYQAEQVNIPSVYLHLLSKSSSWTLNYLTSHQIRKGPLSCPFIQNNCCTPLISL